MKKIGWLFCALCGLVFSAQAQGLKAADEAFEQGNFAQAEKEYRGALESSAEADRLKAQLRITACQFYLGEYLNAAKTIYGYALPKDPLWKARFLLYRVQTAKRVKNAYNPLWDESEIVSDEAEEDLSRLTSDQWQEKINQDFEALWALRDKLINAPVENETLVLNIKGTDVRRLPTLFDVAVNEWVTELARVNEPVLLRAERFSEADFQPSLNAQSSMEKISAILLTASRLDGKNRQDAKVFWHAQRLLLPFDYAHNFTEESRKEAFAAVVAQLETLSGYKKEKTSFFSRLKGYVQPAAKTDYAKAYAAWRGAQLQDREGNYQAAAAWADWAVSHLKASYFTQSAAELAEEIRKPRLAVNAVPGNQNPKNLTVQARLRNLSKVYVRVYKTSYDELKKLYYANRRSAFNSWEFLSNLTSSELKDFVARAPFKTFAGSVSYDKPHAYKTVPLALPELEKGFYVAAVSAEEDFSGASAPVAGAILNVTDLALFVTAAVEGDPADYRVTPATKNHTLRPEVFRAYALDLKTGQPVPGADVTMFTDWKGTRENGRTQEDGLLSVKRGVTVGADKDSSFFIRPLAHKDGSYSFGDNSSVYFHFYPNDPVKLFVETDRAIYRAGQKVQFSVNVFSAAARGWTVRPGARVKITARDANWDVFHTQTLTANAMGTVSGEFTVPEGRLLGGYSLQAETSASGRKYTERRGFKVDDYKRPDYTLTLENAQKPFEYGKTAQVQGNASYYTGAALQKAEVSYTVTRQTFRLPYWWWMPYSASSSVAADGTVTTDDKGNFKIEFTPSVPADGLPEEYVVSASVRDQSGRKIDVQKAYRASVKAHFFALDFTQGFYDENKPASLASLRLTDVNGSDAAGKVRVEIARLENVLPPPAADAQDGETPVYAYGRYENAQNLDKLFGQNKVEAVVLTREYEFKKSGAQTVSLPALPEGIYQLTLKNNKADTQKFVFLVAAENSKLALPETAIVQHKTYYPGSSARILMGAGALHAAKRVEVYQGKFLRKREVAAAGVSVYTVPVANADRGGLSLRWFGASDYKMYTDSASFDVPYDNKELNVTLKGPETVKPGQKAVWKLTAKDATGSGIQGQASVTVYDKSLDYYAAKQLPLGLGALFPGFSFDAGFSASAGFSHAASFMLPAEETDDDAFSSLPLPNINLLPHLRRFALMKNARMAMARSAGGMNFAVAEDSLDVAEGASFDMGTAEYAAAKAAPTAVAGALEAPESAEEDLAEDRAEIRTDFSETAYFNPALPVNGGAASVAVTMPQSLTAWNIMGFVLTKNADLGTFSASAVTRKDFMVRLALPRFYREGDQSQLKALVTNLTAKKQSVQVELFLKKDGVPAARNFGISKTVQTVTVPAQGTAEAVWNVSVPDGVGVLSVTVTARAGKESDGEQKEIPLLPSRERLMATDNVALKDGKNTLALTELQDNKDARPETAVLQINPSLILTVLNAMPSLQNSPYKDLLSQLNKYVPLAVVNKLYVQYPQLRQAVAALPKRTTAKPAWNANDALRRTLLEQTPWLQASRGGETENLISLFDPALVGKEKASALKNILSYQNASGAFAWLPGGRDDSYLTLYVLDSFGEAYRFGAEIPQAEVRKAAAWVTDEINRTLKQDPEGNISTVAYALYAAQTLSVYPQTWKEIKAAYPHIKAWIDWADKQAKFMTPFGKAYAAAVYHRLGETQKAEHYLTVLLAQMKTNPLTGAYFAPEAQSWVWYNDTMSTQTATLKTLLEIRPSAPETDAMVQWILFNRKAQEWDSARSTAEAVYCLLDVMQKKGLMNEPSSYQVTWGNQTARKTVQPFDWTEDLRWEKQGASITPADYTASVEKRGGLTDFASLSVIYTSKDPKASPKGVLNVKREYFVKFVQDGVSKIRPVEDLSSVKVGDEVEVHLTLNADSAFDYVLLSDPRPSGFESRDLLSGWTWNPVPVYQENRDASTQFYINWLPAGEMKLKYILRPTLEGEYRALPAQLQSMYAPEFGAHTAGQKLSVQ